MSNDLLLAISVLVLYVLAVAQVRINQQHRKALTLLGELMAKHTELVAVTPRPLRGPIGPPEFCGEKTAERTWCAYAINDEHPCPVHGTRVTGR